MDGVLTSFAVLAIVIVYLGMGLWIFAGIIAVGATSLLLLGGFSLDRLGATLQSSVWGTAKTWEFSAIPLFIWMGEILFHSNVSSRLFRGLAPWVNWLPGRLLHTNIGGCTLFASVSGSSTATTATIGKITMTELEDRHYSSSLAMGSLAASGSIGLMIPPSIAMIIYGVLSGVSVSELFVAGFFPGLLLAALFSGYVIAVCAMRPELSPADSSTYSWGERLAALLQLLPVVIIAAIVIGGIYSGIATPSEGAAVGVLASLVVAIVTREMSWRLFWDSLISAVQTSCMICIILVAAGFLSMSLGFLHVPMLVAEGIASLNLGAWGLLLVLTLFYVALGCLLDGMSIIVMTLPIVLPLIVGAGFDPLWFGVYLVLMIEIAMITPPVGFNIFVMQGLTEKSIGRISLAVFPFFVLMIVAQLMIAAFPAIALWLPEQLLK